MMLPRMLTATSRNPREPFMAHFYGSTPFYSQEAKKTRGLNSLSHFPAATTRSNRGCPRSLRRDHGEKIRELLDGERTLRENRSLPLHRNRLRERAVKGRAAARAQSAIALDGAPNLSFLL